ncbi:MAG: aminopeptidase P family protein [FCB group bacterium]|jgi:Xaa-Pro aminopeptidase
MKSLIKLFLCILFYIPLLSQSPYENYKYKYPYTDGVPAERYKARRDSVLQSLTNHSAAIIFSSDFYVASSSSLTHQIQNSNLYYLTGMPAQKAVLLLIPEGFTIDGKIVKEILFIEPQLAKNILWNGVEMGINDADHILKIENVLNISELNPTLEKIFRNRDTLFIAEFPRANPAIFNDKLTFEEHFETIKQLKEKYTELNIESGIPVLKKLRSIKDIDEIRLLQKAIDITVKGHIETIKSAKPGNTEYELEATMEYVFKRLGAENPGYASIIGAGPDACILHSITNRDTINPGELVLMDCGAEYHGYTADISRTFPISGKFSREQKIIYNIVIEAQDSAFAECYPGNATIQPHVTAKRIITQRLLELGIIKNESEVINYFPHGTSHQIGLEVHDYGYGDVLNSGNVITIEPGIYIPAGSDTDSKWWNIGVRVEDDVLITDIGHKLLSKDLPRKAEDIENLMK